MVRSLLWVPFHVCYHRLTPCACAPDLASRERVVVTAAANAPPASSGPSGTALQPKPADDNNGANDESDSFSAHLDAMLGLQDGGEMQFLLGPPRSRHDVHSRRQPSQHVQVPPHTTSGCYPRWLLPHE